MLDTSLTAATRDCGRAGVMTVAELADQQETHQVVTQVIPGLLVVFALVLLAFGLPKLIRRRPKDAGPPGSGAAPDLAGAGVTRRPSG